MYAHEQATSTPQHIIPALHNWQYKSEPSSFKNNQLEQIFTAVCALHTPKKTNSASVQTRVTVNVSLTSRRNRQQIMSFEAHRCVSTPAVRSLISRSVPMCRPSQSLVLATSNHTSSSKFTQVCRQAPPFHLTQLSSWIVRTASLTERNGSNQCRV